MKIYLIRHGESEGNVDKSKYFEKLDCEIVLTDKGKSDAVRASETIMNLSDTLQRDIQIYPRELEPTTFNMYYSPYTRARETANIISDRLLSFNGYNINEYVESPLIHERAWGGLRDIVVSRQKSENHFNFFYRPTNGESYSDTYTRAALFHQWLLNNSKYENNIVVAHGEFNKLYLMHLLKWSIKDFEKWSNPKNGEVWLIEDGRLCGLTPLTINKRFSKKIEPF